MFILSIMAMVNSYVSPSPVIHKGLHPFPQHYTIIAVTFMIPDAHPNLGWQESHTGTKT